MSDFNLEIRIALHERLTQIRGRKVSLDKLSKACDQHLGNFSFEPFECFFDEIHNPWQLRLLWDGPDGDIPREGRLAWYPSRDDALRAVVRMIDQYRLYPDRIENTDDGRVVLVADHPIFEMGPLRYHEPDPALLSMAQNAFAGRGGNWRGEVLLRAAEFPGLDRSQKPYGADEVYWDQQTLSEGRLPFTEDGTPITDMGTEGLLQFTPEGAAAACVAIGGQLNIALSLDVARQLLSDVMGFDNWAAFNASWLANQVFQPYLFQDKVTGQSFFCRDAASAMAALAEVAGTLSNPNDFEWAIKSGFTDDFVFALNGPLRHITDKRFNWTRRDTEQERKDPFFDRVRIESARQGQFHHALLGPSPGSFWNDFSIPAGDDTAQCLREVLGVDLHGAARVRLSDIRLQVRAIDVGGVHVTTGRHYDGASKHFFYECLNPVTGRRDKHREAVSLVDRLCGKVWHDEGENELLRAKNGDLTLCEARSKKRPVQVRWRSLSEEDEESLIAFLGMTPTATGGAYSQTVKDNLLHEMSESFKVTVREGILRFHLDPTFRERRQAQVLTPPQQAEEAAKSCH